MNQNYIKPDSWSIIEEGFDKDLVKSSESIFSLGNGAMGQRANFEETYTGETFQGSYIAGVYYPDKTRVGWWKNGYPEYFFVVQFSFSCKMTCWSVFVESVLYEQIINLSAKPTFSTSREGRVLPF